MEFTGSESSDQHEVHLDFFSGNIQILGSVFVVNVTLTHGTTSEFRSYFLKLVPLRHSAGSGSPGSWLINALISCDHYV